MDTLQISPLDLRFRFEVRKLNPTTLTLTNPTGEPFAFKVKTTTPKKFCVRPSSGVVEPDSSVEVTVIMQVQREKPDLKNCKDKFLVQAAKLLTPNKEQLSPDTFDKTRNDVRETKLRVILEEPEAPTPVMEDEPLSDDKPAAPQPWTAPASAASKPAATSSVDSAVRGHSFQTSEDLATVTADRNRYKSQVAELERSLTANRHEVAKLKAGSAFDKPATSAVKTEGLQVSIIHLLLVAILAFLLGQYL